MLARALAFAAMIVFAAPAGAGSGGPMSAYDFSFTSIDGEPLPLSEYRGKVVMVVNTASFCGYTYQYNGLQALWDRYRGKDFVLLGVPSNDFGKQEPGSSKDIKTFCEVNFAIDFPMTEKVHVKGPNADPFYKWADAELGDAAAPKWNFHKYLIGPDGKLIAWFPTKTEPQAKEVTAAIDAALAKSM